MRKPEDCPRERLPVRVLLEANGTALYDELLPPAGLWRDGSAGVYQRLAVAAGPQRLFIGMNERGETDRFDYALEQVVELAPGQHVVVEFDAVRETFRFRTE